MFVEKAVLKDIKTHKGGEAKMLPKIALDNILQLMALFSLPQV